MPANPMLEEVDAAEIGKKVGTAAAKGAGKAGIAASKGAGKAGVAMGKAGKRAAVEGKAAYKKRQDEKRNVSIWPRFCRNGFFPLLIAACFVRPDANNQPDV